MDVTDLYTVISCVLYHTTDNGGNASFGPTYACVCLCVGQVISPCFYLGSPVMESPWQYKWSNL